MYGKKGMGMYRRCMGRRVWVRCMEEVCWRQTGCGCPSFSSEANTNLQQTTGTPNSIQYTRHLDYRDILFHRLDRGSLSSFGESETENNGQEWAWAHAWHIRINICNACHTSMYRYMYKYFPVIQSTIVKNIASQAAPWQICINIWPLPPSFTNW